MSEPDAVPLPREGEVFFDVRGEARSMRLSWYADSGVAVFSIWQGNRCTGTFRLPFVDLARMVQTLQAGPPGPAHQPPPQPGQDYSATVEPYGSAPDAGINYGRDQRYDYGATAARQDFAPAASHQVGQGYPASQDLGTSRYGADQDYGDQGYGTGHDFSAGQGRGADGDYGIGHSPAAGHDYDSRSGFAAAPAYGSDRPYGGDPYHPSDPYGVSEPYHSSEPYHAGEPYPVTEQYRPAEQHSQGEPYRPLRHAADQAGHGLRDYAPPTYGDLPPYHDERGVAAAPAATPRPDDWPPPAVPARSKHSADSESAPDTAMMGFPSVPARNGPSGYR